MSMGMTSCYPASHLTDLIKIFSKTNQSFLFFPTCVNNDKVNIISIMLSGVTQSFSDFYYVDVYCSRSKK